MLQPRLSNEVNPSHFTAPVATPDPQGGRGKTDTAVGWGAGKVAWLVECFLGGTSPGLNLSTSENHVC